MSRHHDDTGASHPLARFVTALHTDLSDLAEVSTWSLDAETTAALVPQIAVTVAQLLELEARVIAHADTLALPATIGATSVGQWLARTTHVTEPEAGRKARLANHLAAHEQLRAAMAGGGVHAEQATVIAKAVDELDRTHASWQEQAETHLIGEAVDHDAHDLRTLGRRILETIDPDKADEHEARLLEAEEARARKKTRFGMRDDGEGLTHGSFTIPSGQASVLGKALASLAAPKHVRATEGAGSYDYEKPTPEKLGKALCEYIENYPADRLPSMGGMNATVVVTMTLETLLGGLKAAHLDTGLDISPGQARRMACEAGVIPAVLDGDGHTLDLGRLSRFHSKPQRLAITIEQEHCQHPACRAPAAYCHVHHTIPWSEGGETNIRDAVLLCPFHHHQAHATGTTYPLRT